MGTLLKRRQFLPGGETWQDALSAAGIRQAKSYQTGVSDNPVLQGIEAHGKELGSEEINQFETIVIEGLKESKIFSQNRNETTR